MKITKKGFPAILADNDKAYLDFLTDAILKHSDPEADVLLDKRDSIIRVVIKPSESAFKQEIIADLLAGHRLMRMKIIFSKSLAIQKSISYHIEF